jgi:signal transduction histidine kinase
MIMRERAESAGGRFHVDAAPDKGTCIVVEVRASP